MAARVATRKQVLATECMRAEEVEGRLKARQARFKCVTSTVDCLA